MMLLMVQINCIGGLDHAAMSGKQAPKQDHQGRSAQSAQMLESFLASTIWKHWNLNWQRSGLRRIIP
jgi:hypothetical protein